MGMWRGGGGRLHGAPQRPQTSGWRIFVRAVGLFRPYVWGTALLLVLIAASAVLNLFPALIIGSMVNHAKAGGDVGKIDLLFLALLGAVIVSGLLDVASGYLNQVIGQGVMVRLRQALHDHLQKLSIHFFTQTRTGEILSRVTNDVSSVQQAVTGTFTDFVTNAITFGTSARPSSTQSPRWRCFRPLTNGRSRSGCANQSTSAAQIWTLLSRYWDLNRLAALR